MHKMRVLFHVITRFPAPIFTKRSPAPLLVLPIRVGFARLKMGGNLSYPQVELKDKVAIVTGGNAGIGYETAKALAIMGAHTIIACRSEERGQQVSIILLAGPLTKGLDIVVEAV